MDYIAARAEEAELARLAGDTGGMENKAAMAAEEKELAEWVKSAKEAGGASTEAPLPGAWARNRPRRRPRLSTPRLQKRDASCVGPVLASRSSLARPWRGKGLQGSPRA